jgi:hypothetical protein
MRASGGFVATSPWQRMSLKAVVAVVVVRYLMPKMIALVLRRIEVRTGPG